MAEWPEECKEIICQCWEKDSNVRPLADEIYETLDELASRRRLWWDGLEEGRRAEIIALFTQSVECNEDVYGEEVRLDLRLKCGLSEEQCDQLPFIVYNLRKESD